MSSLPFELVTLVEADDFTVRGVLSENDYYKGVHIVDTTFGLSFRVTLDSVSTIAFICPRCEIKTPTWMSGTYNEMTFSVLTPYSSSLKCQRCGIYSAPFYTGLKSAYSSQNSFIEGSHERFSWSHELREILNKYFDFYDDIDVLSSFLVIDELTDALIRIKGRQDSERLKSFTPTDYSWRRRLS